MRRKCEREAAKADLAGKHELASSKWHRAERLAVGMIWLGLLDD
jgi:hypothetical protein